MIISEDELAKQVKFDYDTENSELRVSIKVTATVRMHKTEIGTHEEEYHRKQLIKELRRTLRNLGGVE